MGIFLESTKEEKIEYLASSHLQTQIAGDLFEFNGVICDVDVLENDEDEYFIAVTFKKDELFNENVMILYDSTLEPLGKLAYAYNEKDAKISFDYFFVRKDLRGQHLGQSMMNLFLDKMNEIFDEYCVFVNPYAFDVTFNGIKGYDYDSQLAQYNLEQFYLKNGFLLTEDPKKYAFSNIEYEPDVYTLTKKPVDDLFEDFIKYEKNNTMSFGITR